MSPTFEKKFSKTAILFFLVLILQACANGQSNRVKVIEERDNFGVAKTADYGMQRRNLSEYFAGVGIIKYFLPDIPQWANYSQTAVCRRNYSLRYFNYKSLRESFSLSYEQAVQFQYMFNKNYEQQKRDYGADYLLFSNEENLFFRVSDMVQGNIKEFHRPEFKRVHVVWIDPFITKSEDIKKLKKLMDNSTMDLGHPVFVSLCLGHFDFSKFFKDNDLEERNIRAIPYEMFSIYDEASVEAP